MTGRIPAHRRRKDPYAQRLPGNYIPPERLQPIEVGPTGRRPKGRGHGLDGPPCPERADLDQGYDLLPPRQAMCVRCGRVTARRDADGMPWCGGNLADASVRGGPPEVA